LYKKPRFNQRSRGPIIRERDDDRRIPVHDRLGAGFQYMIDWGVGPGYMILQEEGFLLMSESSRWLMLEFQMNTHIIGIQKKCMFMMILIGLSGVQRV
jgi:hypothetical protein